VGVTVRAPFVQLEAGGVTACARLETRVACWGSWADDVPAGVAFDAAALRDVPRDVDALALGWTHGCARHADGAVRCFGRLGPAQAPAEVPALRGARAIASGRGFTCGVDPAGRLTCFADRVYTGLRGYGGPSADAAVEVAGPRELRLVAATSSSWQLCAAGDAVYCWPSIDAPAQQIAAPPDPAQVALAPDHGCARYARGEVWCWTRAGRSWGAAARIEGLRADALVGLYDRICARDDATWRCLAPGGAPREWTAMRGAAHVAGGMGFVCGRWPDGVVHCAGDDTYGQLGTFGPAPAPVATIPPRRAVATDVAALAMGAAHACVAHQHATVACWGGNAAGQLGDGTVTPRGAPVIVPGLRGVVQLSAGNAHTCARDAAGDVWCWGAMTLDHGEDVDPVPFVIGRRPRRLARHAREVVSGVDHACAWTSAPPGLRCWGSRFALGARTSPPFVRIAVPPGTRALAAGGAETCALGAAGEVRCFGAGAGAWQPGGPFVLAPDRALAVAMVAGDSGCEVQRDGAVRCWGQNTRGQLGDGSRAARAVPERAVGIEDAVQVARGDLHACALGRDGAVRCWGANDAGQLGDGTTRDRWRPVVVPGLAGVVAIAAGGDTTCALLGDHRVECWGGSLTEAPGADAAASARDPRGLGAASAAEELFR
jgi:hypothetical protein